MKTWKIFMIVVGIILILLIIANYIISPCLSCGIDIYEFGCFEAAGAYSLHYQDTCYNESGFYVKFSNINPQEKIIKANLIISLNNTHVLINKTLNSSLEKNIFIEYPNNFSNQEKIKMGVETITLDKENLILDCGITNELSYKKCQ